MRSAISLQSNVYKTMNNRRLYSMSSRLEVTSEPTPPSLCDINENHCN